jgi:hypothetical protein
VLIAKQAKRRIGSLEDPPPLVTPIITDECTVCPWQTYCRDLLGPNAPSLILEAGRLDVREWKALASMGIETAQDLACLDLEDESWWDNYLPEVTHQREARTRLAKAVVRANMALAGMRLKRTSSGPIDVPRADIEIDFDIEWDVDNKVCLWGALLTDYEHPEGKYHHFDELEPMDEAEERALALQFLDWLRSCITLAREKGKTIRIYHYAHPERTHLIRIFGEETVSDVLAMFVDLLPIVRSNYIGVAGLSLKEVAPEFCATWHADDPGGLQAQRWIEEARSTENESKRKEMHGCLLQYNKDDVSATAKLRAGLRLVK